VLCNTYALTVPTMYVGCLDVVYPDTDFSACATADLHLDWIVFEFHAPTSVQWLVPFLMLATPPILSPRPHPCGGFEAAHGGATPVLKAAAAAACRLAL
jgi:hypothetical protein